MCGIAGILNLHPAPPPDPGSARTMIDSLVHRGPDAMALHHDADIALAHARLGIIDLEGGIQPMPNEEGTVWVGFNGEIFNYKELRRELMAAGHEFATLSDTEVLVHAYEEHGLDFVHHLNGQFAIALWDARVRRLVLVRDRAGIRPLFHATVAGRLFFASEVKALFAHPAVPRQLDARAVAEIFTFWSAQPPATPFKGVQALPPGCLMVVERGRVDLRRYWDWDFAGPSPSAPPPELDDCADRLRGMLVDAVRLQLRADVPVGAYLSGGLDSSILAAIVRHETDTPLRTFSLTFDDAEFDESGAQQRLVRHLGTRHTTLHCSRDAIARAFPRAIWHTETPILRTAPAPLLLLSGAVRAAGYKVVLTGEGADEVFGGYDLFKEARIRRYWARHPDSIRRPRLLGRLYPYLEHSPVSAPGFARRFFGQNLDQDARPTFAHLPRWSTTRRLWRFFNQETRAELAGYDPVAAFEAGLPAGMAEWPPLGRDQYVEAHTLLSGYLLSSQGDRMAMANSVETRFPYLDHRLIEFAGALPPHYKLHGLTEKYLLRRAMARDLPPENGRRPKQPYRAPDSPCFFPGQRPLPWVEELFEEARLRRNGLFDPAAVQKLYDKCRAGRAIGFGDNMAFVGILSTLLVEEMFVRRTPWHQLAGAWPVAVG